MIRIRRKKNADQPPAGLVRNQGKTRFEWPLLAFPVMVLVALVVLYGISRSIQDGTSTTRAQRHTAAEPASQTAPPESPDAAVPPSRNGGNPTSATARSRRTGSHDGTDPGQETTESRGIIDVPTDHAGLAGPAKTIATLRAATEAGDQATIKRCLDELIAMGDDAIEPLLGLIAEGDGEVGVWAAEALARMGTPDATAALLEALTDVEDGAYKENVAKCVARITDHESWPVLLDTILETQDATVLRAAGASLSQMADAAVVDEIAALYEAATAESELERLSQVLSSISSPKATESLLSLAGDVSTLPQNSLQKAAVSALAKIGDPQSVSYLLRKLEAASPGEGTYLFDTIAQIDAPAAQAPLQYAAAGSKDVSAESGRTAAIYALENYPNEQTCALLENIIAQEDNTTVATAAIRTLEKIRQGSTQTTAKANDTAPAESTVKLAPLEK